MRPVSVMGRSCTCLSKCAPTALALTLPGCTSQSFSSAGFRLGFAGGRHWQKQQEELSVSLPPLSPFCPQDLLPVCPLSLGFSPTSRQSVLTRPSLTLTPSSAVFLCSIAFKASSTMLLHFYFLTISISDHFCLHLATLLILLSHLPFLDSQHSDLLRAQRSFILVNALRDFFIFFQRFAFPLNLIVPILCPRKSSKISWFSYCSCLIKGRSVQVCAQRVWKDLLCSYH